MKSYFLEGPGEVPLVRNERSKLLPHWADPWLLKANDEDPVAHLNIAVGDDGSSRIQADMSGRRFAQDELVPRVLRELQGRFGGVIRNDNDDEL